MNLFFSNVIIYKHNKEDTLSQKKNILRNFLILFEGGIFPWNSNLIHTAIYFLILTFKWVISDMTSAKKILLAWCIFFQGIFFKSHFWRQEFFSKTRAWCIPLNSKPAQFVNDSLFGCNSNYIFYANFPFFLSLPFFSTKYEYPIRIIQMQTTLCKSKIVIQ